MSTVRILGTITAPLTGCHQPPLPIVLCLLSPAHTFRAALRRCSYRRSWLIYIFELILSVESSTMQFHSLLSNYLIRVLFKYPGLIVKQFTLDNFCNKIFLIVYTNLLLACNDGYNLVLFCMF